MRTVNATFEDSDFRKLEKAKNKSGLNWPDFIMLLPVLIEENDKLQYDKLRSKEE